MSPKTDGSQNFLRLGLLPRHIISLFMLVFGVGLSVSFAFTLKEWQDNRLRIAFNQFAQERAQALQREIDGNLEIIYSLGNLFASAQGKAEGSVDMLSSIGDLYATTQNISREEFQNFLEDPLSRYPGIQLIAWAPRVPYSERDAYEEAAYQDGYTDFQISQRDTQGNLAKAPKQEEYFPIFFIKSLQSYNHLLGLDITSESVLRQVIERARDTGEVTVTSSLPFMGKESDEIGWLVFLPIYRTRSAGDTTEERRKNLLGYAVEVIRIGMTASLALERLAQRDIDVLVYDQTELKEQRLLHHHKARSRQTAQAEPVKQPMFPQFEWATTLDMAGRKWTVVCRPAPAFFRNYVRWAPWTVLAAGVLLTLLGVGYFQLIASRTQVVQRLVQQRTAELSDSNTALMREIEERKQAEEKLQTLNKRLGELSAVKDDFVATVTHELRTPLAAIKQEMGLLTDGLLGPVTERQRDMLLRADKNIYRLNDLISNLLDLSKIEAGRLHLNRRRVQIRPLLENAIAAYQVILGKRKVVTDFTPVQDILADPDRVTQVIGNLLSNAAKFTQENGTITFAVRPRAGFVAISVQDDGIGIGQEDIPHLFQRFSQVGGGQTQLRGTGLGLALCKDLIEMHRGKISVTSVPLEGSKFTFTLPLYTPDLALRETFSDMLELAKRKQKSSVGLIRIDARTVLGPSVSLQYLADVITKHIQFDDAVISMEPHCLVVLAVTDKTGLEAMCQRLHAKLVAEIEMRSGKPFHLPLRFGIAVYPEDGSTAQDLMSKASSS